MWHNECQRLTTSSTKSDNEWEQVKSDWFWTSTVEGQISRRIFFDTTIASHWKKRTEDPRKKPITKNPEEKLVTVDPKGDPHWGN